MEPHNENPHPALPHPVPPFVAVPLFFCMNRFVYCCLSPRSICLFIFVTLQPRDPPVFQAPLVGEAAQAGNRKKKRRFLAEAAQQNLPKPVSRNAENKPIPAERPIRTVSSANSKRPTDKLNVDSKPPRALSPSGNRGNQPPYSRRNVSPQTRSGSSPSRRSPSGRSSGTKSPSGKNSVVSRSHSPKSSSGGSSGGSSSGNKKYAIDNVSCCRVSVLLADILKDL